MKTSPTILPSVILLALLALTFSSCVYDEPGYQSENGYGRRGYYVEERRQPVIVERNVVERNRYNDRYYDRYRDNDRRDYQRYDNNSRDDRYRREFREERRENRDDRRDNWQERRDRDNHQQNTRVIERRQVIVSPPQLPQRNVQLQNSEVKVVEKKKHNKKDKDRKNKDKDRDND